MKNYKEVEVNRTELELESVECDRCGDVLSEDDYWCCGVPYFELTYVGGYNSDYPGDLHQVECDLCEQCLEELVGEFARIDKARMISRTRV